MPPRDAPTTELGAYGLTDLSGWEDAPELRFPLSTIVYDKMRRDSQVDSVLRAISLPIMRTGWRLVGDDVDPTVLRFVETELGLDPLDGGRRRRRREGVVFAETLRHALLMLPFGFLPMEQVYQVGPPAPGQDVAGLRLVAHLAKLAPRMPRSLLGIDVARDGGLVGIRQSVPKADGFGWEEVRIPRDRLVMFVHERESGDWTGRSILRSSYGHWLIKGRLMRLGAAIVERNGMGVPVVKYPAGGSRNEALRIAKAFRAGEESGAALPEGYELELVGVSGTTKDELPLLKYHDEAMGRAALAMFLNLGHDNGARALGDTFVDYFVLALGAVIENVETTFTEYVIRDLVTLNFGADTAYPELRADEVNAESTPTAEALKALADAGLLGPIDADLVADVRRRYRLPSSPLELDPGAPFDPIIEDTPAAPEDLAARALAVANRLAALAEADR